MQFQQPRHNFAQKVRTYDTTLRDGEQTPGVRFNAEVKALIARKLDQFGVDVIEAGSAINSRAERKAIREICEAGLNAKIASFARIKKEDIDAVVESGASVVGLVFPASDLHIEKKLKMGKRQALDEILGNVAYAANKGLLVTLMAEDGSRAEADFLKEVSLKAQNEGANTFCVCDTVGALTPEYTFVLFEFLRDGLKMDLSFHGHNDLGLATANTLAALRAGANEFHITVNGLGERAGNASLEQVAFNLFHHYGMHTVRLEMIYEVSKIVAGHSNLFPSWNAPLVGRGVFTHESGIHVDGMLKDPKLYELFDPDAIGRRREISLGKLSGRKSIELKLKELRLQVGEENKEPLLDAVRRMGGMGLEVSDADFVMLVHKINNTGMHEKLLIEEIQVSTGNKISPNAYVRLRFNSHEELIFGASLGDGPVDAAIKAMNNALGEHGATLVSYHVDAITGGSDAGVRINVRVERNGASLTSSAVGTDIVLASAEAYRKALNVLL